MHIVDPNRRFLGSHAVVIGAGIGGLLAARVLSEYCVRVTIFDRDELPSAVDNRPGVPQGRHGHGLLASGLRGLNRLFPGFEVELIANGAVPGDVIGRVRWFQHGHYKAKFASGLDGVLLSRPLLETTLRNRVLRIPNVRIQDNTRVVSLVTSGEQVTGVIAQRGSDNPVGCLANLVVDSGGRGSRTPEWLDELGYGRPRSDEVHVGIGYTTRTFRRFPTDLDGDVGAILAPMPPHQKRIGFMLAMEQDRWIVTLGGWLGEHAPTDHDGFLEFARTLVRPDVYDVIKRAQPLTDAVKFGFPANRRRHYELYKRFPGNYLVIADALCSFNPLYGQGMSTATLEAIALRECLRDASSPEFLWRAFFKKASGIVDGPWMIAAGSDFAFEGVTGPKPAGTDFINWYLTQVHRCASTDQVVCRAFFDVANLLAPAPTLFRPSIVARVLRSGWRRPAGRVVSTDSERRRLLESH